MVQDKPKWLRTRRQELRAYLGPKPRPDFQPYVILAHYRSGTTLLTELLDTHPEIHCAGEILLGYFAGPPRWILRPKAFITRVAAARGTPIGGVTLRTDQLKMCLAPYVHPTPTGFIRRLSREGWRFLHLVRENALLQALSNLEAHAREEWHFTTGEQLPKRPLEIDTKRLIASARWGERCRASEFAALEGVDHLSVVYEKDLQDSARHQDTMDRIFEYLGAPAYPVQASLRKIGVRSLTDRIANYDEFLGAINGSGLEHYLPEAERSASP